MMKHTTLFLIITLFGSISYAQERGIIATADSPHVQLRSINLGDCQWTGGFWGEKYDLCEEVMVPHMGEILKGDVGFAYDNFKIAAGLKEGEHGGTNWHDGDFYKWMESAMYVYANNRDPEILADLDEIIAVIGKAQMEDGYLQTVVQITEKERFSNRQLHEMYNAGHLYTSACIHHRVTGKTNFLDIAIKHADFLYDTFVPCPPELKRFGFNQTHITGLVELYRTTGDKRYLKLAQQFIDYRGKDRNDGTDAVSYKTQGDMSQDRTPFRNEKEAVGHAVLAMYLYSGAADVYAETGEKALMKTLDSIWHNVVDQKMYITGALGQTHHGVSSQVDMIHEGFLSEYMMPNSTAYNETCANLCNGMFNYRMLGVKGESKYADILELVMYNSGLSGISQEGTHYFYTNPLRRTADQHMDKTDYRERTPYIPCFCCPPNLVRSIAKSSGWAYSLSNDGVTVNLYGSNVLNTKLLDGSGLKLVQETNYPWEGSIRIAVEKCGKGPFEIALRIPGWADSANIRVNGKLSKVKPVPGTFARIKRKWKKGDVVVLELPLEPKLLVGNPRIEEVRNQVAIKMGPLVYCVETPDLPENARVLDVFLPTDIELKPFVNKDLWNGTTLLEGEVLLQADRAEGMYHEIEKPIWEKAKVSFVPYFAWSNRGEAEMTVWMPLVWR